MAVKLSSLLEPEEPTGPVKLSSLLEEPARPVKLSSLLSEPAIPKLSEVVNEPIATPDFGIPEPGFAEALPSTAAQVTPELAPQRTLDTSRPLEEPGSLMESTVRTIQGKDVLPQSVKRILGTLKEGLGTAFRGETVLGKDVQKDLGKQINEIASKPVQDRTKSDDAKLKALMQVETSVIEQISRDQDTGDYWKDSAEKTREALDETTETRVAEASNYLSGDGSPGKIKENFKKDPIKFSESLAITVADNAAQTVQSLVPGVGQAALLLEGAGRFSESLDKREFDIDEDIKDKYSYRNAVPETLVEHQMNKFLVAPGKLVGLGNLVNKLADTVKKKVLARVIIGVVGAPMEGLEEAIQGGTEEYFTAQALSEQARRLSDSGDMAQAIPMQAKAEELISGIVSEKRFAEAIVGTLVGFGISGPSTVSSVGGIVQEGAQVKQDERVVSSIDMLNKISQPSATTIPVSEPSVVPAETPPGRKLEVREELLAGKNQLKDIETKIDVLNSQIKRTPRGKEQNTLVRERKVLNEERSNLLRKPSEELKNEISTQLEAATTIEETEGLMEAIKQEMGREDTQRGPGELADLNKSFNAAREKTESIKAAEISKEFNVKSTTKEVEPEIERMNVAQEALETISPEKKSPKLMLTRDEGLQEEIDNMDLPEDKKARFTEMLSNARDKQIGLQSRSAYDRAGDEILKAKRDGRVKNITLGEIDFRNIGGGNKALSHDDVNIIISEVGGILKKNSKGGPLLELYRKGGDEIGIISTGTKFHLNKVLNKSKKEIEALIKSKTLKGSDGTDVKVSEIPHPKHGGMPTGTGEITFSVINDKDVDFAGIDPNEPNRTDFGRMAKYVDVQAEHQKATEIIAIAEKLGYIIDKDGNTARRPDGKIKREPTKLPRTKPDRETGKDVPGSVDAKTPTVSKKDVGKSKEAPAKVEKLKETLPEGTPTEIIEKSSVSKGKVKSPDFDTFKKKFRSRKKSGETASDFKKRQDIEAKQAYSMLEQDVDETPTLLDKSGKAVEGVKKRKRGFKSDVGAVGIQRQRKLKDATKDAQKFQDMTEWQDREIKKKFKFSFGKVRDFLGTKLIQSEYVIARHLDRTEAGKSVLKYFHQTRGASEASQRILSEAEKDIYSTVPHDLDKVFARLLLAFRIIEVEKVRATRGTKVKLSKQEKKMLPEGESEEILIPKSISNPQGITGIQAQAYIDSIKEQNPDVYKGLEIAMNKYWTLMQSQVKELHKEGIISTASRDFLLENHKHYSLRKYLHHIDPEGSSIDAGGRKVNVHDSGIKQLGEGSEEALINDPRYLMQQSILRTQSRIFKNRANKELYEFVKENPNNSMGIEVEKGDGKIPTNMTRVTSWKDGEEQNLIMPEEMAKAWVSNDPQITGELTKWIKRVLLVPILKAGATGVNPGFAFSNTPRDIMFTWFKQHEAYSPFLPIALGQIASDMVSVAGDVVKRKGLVKAYIENGSGMDLMTTQGLLFEKKFGETRSPLSEKVQQVQEIMGWVGTTSELLTRIALMKRLISKGMSVSDAAYTARVNLDFAQGGTFVKAMDNFVPYLNASVQGTRGTVQAFKSNPKIAAFKAAQIITYATGIAFWTQYMDKDEPPDERFSNNISTREKENGWLIPLPLKFRDPKTGQMRFPYLKIAKDQGQRVFAAIGEGIGTAMAGGEFDFDQLKMAVEDALPVNVFLNLPPTIDAIMSYVYNKDFYRNKDVWTGRKVSAANEKYPQTEKMWIVLGEKTGLSPERAKTAFSKIFPRNIYTDALMMGYNQISGTMSDKDKSKVNQTIWEKLSSSPVSRKVLRLSWPKNQDEFKLMKDINEYGIETHYENGKPKPRLIVNASIKKAEIKRNDLRQVADFELTDVMKKMTLTNNYDELSKFIKGRAAEVKKELGPIQAGKEVKRIARRFSTIMKKNQINKSLRENGRKTINNEEIDIIFNEVEEMYKGIDD